MNASTRRQFLARSGSLLALGTAGGSAFAAMGPNDKFDLVIKGGDVLDPSQSLRGRRDIGIRYGVVEAVEADIPAERALRVIDAARQAGDARPRRPARPRLSLRLRDRHSGRRADAASRAPPPACRRAMPAPTISPPSAASSSAQTRTRLYAFVHIANFGLTPFPLAGALQHRLRRRWTPAPRRSPRTPTSRIGVKVRMSENVIAKQRRRAAASAPIQACELSRRGGARVMCHIGGVETVAADVRDPRPAAARRHPHPRLFGRAQHRRRLHQHRAERPAAAGGARRQAARRHLRRRPRRRQFRLHGRGSRDRAGRSARHHLLRHPRGLGQHARACPISPG